MELKYAFGNNEWTAEKIGELTDEEILSLRNDVAASMGVKAMAKFNSREAAIDGTMKALERYAKRDLKQRQKIEEKQKKQSDRPEARCAQARVVERPTRSMFRTIHKLCDHPGEGYRIRRWDNYKDGMTLLDTMEGNEMTHLDVLYYVKHNLMELREPNDQEFEKLMADWCAKRNIENPIEAKQRAAEQKAKLLAETKARVEAEAEAKKAKAKAEAEAKAKAKDKKAA